MIAAVIASLVAVVLGCNALLLLRLIDGDDLAQRDADAREDLAAYMVRRALEDRRRGSYFWP